MQEIEKICSEETDRASQARSDELSMHHERNRTTVSQMWLKFGFAEQREFLVREQLWSDPRFRSSFNDL